MTEIARLILANAGCGKTFSLANRIIGWLIEHRRVTGRADPGGVLAATFTRKAAGEIQQRILRHLAHGALCKERRTAYADTVGLGDVEAQEYQHVLEEVVADLGRLQVGTIDSTFHRLARAMPEQLQLPEGWTIADETALSHIRRDALDDWLGRSTPEELDALVATAESVVLKRGGHASMLEPVWGDGRGGGLIDLWRRSGLDGPAGPAWRWLTELQDTDICPSAAAHSADEIKRAFVAFAAAPLPQTAKGTDVTVWVNGRVKVLQSIAAGQWEEVLGHKLVQAVDLGLKYGSGLATDAVVAALQPIIEHAALRLSHRLRRIVSVWADLLEALDLTVRRHQRAAGQYSYADVSDQLARAGILADLDPLDLACRLDGTIRSVALDEFQDTSDAQFRVLEPLIEEICSGQGGHDGPRHCLVVADPKQSIYGWRGGTPRLIERVRNIGGEAMVLDELPMSYRSSQAIIDFVNGVFGDLPGNAAVQNEAVHRPGIDLDALSRFGINATTAAPPIEQAVEEWHFTHHSVAPDLKSLPGAVHAWLAPRGPRGDGDGPTVKMATELLKQRVEAGAETGVLCRSNAQVAALSASLREAGVLVSEESAAGSTGLPAVDIMLDAVRLADHPGDRWAAIRLSHSPLGPQLNLPPLETIGSRCQVDAVLSGVSSKLRRRIADEGLADTIARLAHETSDDMDVREFSAVLELAELAAAFPRSRQVRLQDFIDLVATKGIAQPSDARVRVMTMHAAKGLEFQEVMLPWLDEAIVKDPSATCLPWQDSALSPVIAVAPRLNMSLRCWAPAVGAFATQGMVAGYADGLSLFYVAVTRAKQALHLILRQPSSTAKSDAALTPSKLLRAALPDLDDAMEAAVAGDLEPAWHQQTDTWTGVHEHTPPPTPPPVGQMRVRLRPGVSHMTPSSTDVREHVAWRLAPGGPRRRGVVLHELFAAVCWLDDGPPSPEAIDRAFNAAAMQLGRPAGRDLRADLMDRFERALASEIGDALRRTAHAHWGEVSLEVLPEESILVRLDDGVLDGRIDRLVLGRDGDGKVVRAAVLDYKTSHATADEADRTYAAQLARYARGVSAVWKVPIDQIETRLLLVD